MHYWENFLSRLKINLYVGDRNKNEIADVQYELPIQAVTEAIVNAVAHCDYTSNASVQVMLFADRLEISNPGKLPVGLTVEKLFTAHSSIPANPLLAESLYLYGTIERMGTGTEEIAKRCAEMGLKKPLFVQDAEFKVILYKNTATEQVAKLLSVLDADMNATTADLMNKLHLKHRPTFIYSYIQPALKLGLIEPLYPDNPNHPQQKYRLTEKAVRLKKI
jgi:predicted HTH transcriptional regulator